MKVQVEEESPIKKKVEVTLDKDLIAQHLDDAYREIGKTAKLKGFRPGKAPRHVLEKYYERDARDQAMRSLIDQSYPEALQQEQLQPVSYPQIEVKSFDPAAGFVYAAQIEVRPEIGTVQKYKGLKLKQDPIKVSQEEIEEQLKAYQNHHAKLIPIDPPRSLRAGDVITFDYEALREGEPFEGNKVDDYMAELGAGVLLKEFEEKLSDAQPGDKREIDVTLPEDFADKSFAGKKMHYSVVLKEAKQKVVPKLDDDFAKDLGHDDLKAFKAHIQAEIMQSKEQANRGKLHREIVTQLIAANDFPVPSAMIEAELASMYDQFQHNLRSQGQTAEGVGMTPEAFRQQNQDEAKLRIQGMLLFQRIWADEDIQVAEEDREKKLEELARVMHQQKVAVRQYYESTPERRGQLDVLILQDKTLDFILAEAKIESS